MAKRRKKKKKILYHRVVLLMVLALLFVYLLFAGVKKVYDMLNAPSKETQTVEHKEVKKVQIEEGQRIVVIDAGHGGYDSGSEAFNGTYEKDVTLKVAKKVGAYIEKQRSDIKVLYTRENDDYYWTTDNRTDLFYRVNLATENNADLFLSIHLNSNDESNEVRGHEIWVSLTSSENEIFANRMDDELNALAYNECRGIKDESEQPLLVLHYNTVPSVLVELGYINNVEDFTYINSEQGSSALAEALAKGMLQTLEDLNG